MATEEHFNVMNFPPSPPFLPTLSSVPPHPFSPTSSNSMVVYQGSGQSSMDNPLQNRQQSVSMAAPTNIEELDMATEEYLIYWNSPSPSSNSMVVNYQVSCQSSMDNPLPDRQQSVSMARPANSGDQSDMATEEHFDVTSLLNLPQWSPPPSPCSSANSIVVYQQEGSGRSFMDFVDRPLYIAGDMALWRQQLLQLWMDASDELGPRGGIMSINNKENLPQGLECLGISLLHLYVEDKFEMLLYWSGKSSWAQLCWYLLYAIIKLLQGGELAWAFACDDLERNDYSRGVFGNERVSMGVWRIGPREWVAKIRYQRLSLESPFYVDEQGRDCHSAGINAQVVLEDARLDFPGHLQDFLHTVAVAAALRKDPDEDDIDLLRKTPVIDGWRLNYLLIVPWQFGPTANQDEDFVNGEVEGTEEAEIAESQLNLGPSRKKQRKEKTPTGERGNKKSNRVKNVIPLEKILQVKDMSLKGAAEFLKVSRSALKRACREHGINSRSALKRAFREHGINRWPPCNKYESITQSLPNETPAVVDQEGIPQLTFDTLPSDQALTTTVDTNSVAEETASQQFLLAVRQENPYENSGNAEVEAVGMGGVGTRESEMRRNENAPRRERGKYKTTGVRIELALEEILQYKKMRLDDAARELKVSQSALKRACREYGINRWPPRNKHEGIDQALPNETPAVVDQQGNPQLTSNTLPSDQVLTTTVNTNSVTEETVPRPFLQTVRQDNPNEDYGNDEVEAVGIRGARIGEGEMKKNEKAPAVVRGKYQTTGVRIEIALEEILRYREMPIKDAARELKVGRSTLKRICRDYNIHRWPPRDEHVLTDQSHPNESPTVVDQERIPQLNSDTLLPSNQITATSNTNSVTVKAKYKGLRIKFQLFSPWQKVELEQEVKKRLQLDAATYYINYKDEDDEMTLIGCDEDLEGYISSTIHLGTNSIELFLEPK